MVSAVDLDSRGEIQRLFSESVDCVLFLVLFFSITEQSGFRSAFLAWKKSLVAFGLVQFHGSTKLRVLRF